MKFLMLFGLASVASAHTLFTTLFINGENQGDGTCVRMPKDGSTATSPVEGIKGDDMACGRDGENPVAYVCPAPSGSTLTFEFRLWPDAQQPGSIDPGHLGPCAVYLKKVDDMFKDEAKGSGWFKVWEDGYNKDSGKWCVETLVEKNGLLSVNLPAGLPSGYYLVRPEILALHQAHRGDPQFYVNCAQIFVPNGVAGPLNIPDEFEVNIPGYVDHDTPGAKFDIYQQPLPAYPIPGPKVFIPQAPKASKASSPSLKAAAAAASKNHTQEAGVIPDDCLLKNANWCAKPIAPYTGEDACWAGVNGCYAQSKKCWSSAPASGSANCESWSKYCAQLNSDCASGDFEGPSALKAEEKYAEVPGDIPQPWNDRFDETKAKGSGTPIDLPTTVAAPAAPSPTAPEQPPTEPEKPKDGGEDRLQVSTDGRCGGTTGLTCQGSKFGGCCSSKGQCGGSTRHCGCKCQKGFGECKEQA